MALQQTRPMYYAAWTAALRCPGSNTADASRIFQLDLEFYTEDPNSFRVDFQTDTMHHGSDISGTSGGRPLGHPRTHQQHVPDAQLSRPVPLEHVDTDLTVGAHVGVENLGQEVALGWGGRKVLPQQEFHTEQASGIRGPLWSEGEGA